MVTLALTYLWLCVCVHVPLCACLQALDTLDTPPQRPRVTVVYPAPGDVVQWGVRLVPVLSVVGATVPRPGHDVSSGSAAVDAMVCMWLDDEPERSCDAGVFFHSLAPGSHTLHAAMFGALDGSPLGATVHSTFTVAVAADLHFAAAARVVRGLRACVLHRVWLQWDWAWR